MNPSEAERLQVGRIPYKIEQGALERWRFELRGNVRRWASDTPGPTTESAPTSRVSAVLNLFTFHLRAPFEWERRNVTDMVLCYFLQANERFERAARETAPAVARIKTSDSRCAATEVREAPSENRNEISCWRAAARESRSAATLVHAMTSNSETDTNRINSEVRALPRSIL